MNTKTHFNFERETPKLPFKDFFAEKANEFKKVKKFFLFWFTIVILKSLRLELP